ncbi:MAG: hypothetical protein KAS38_22820, partial [Anaerolineales bacterium]|nr:hypothetical protein [Anaerolineales bacterium]
MLKKNKKIPGEYSQQYQLSISPARRGWLGRGVLLELNKKQNWCMASVSLNILDGIIFSIIKPSSDMQMPES